MEVEGGHDRKFTVMVCEMVGTALFMYAIIMTSTGLTVPFSLFASILIFGGITGGHFNPAVSLGVYIAKSKDYTDNMGFLLLIWLGQFLGGFIAMGLSFMSLYSTKPPPTTVPADLVPRLCPQGYPMFDNEPDCDNWDGEGSFMFDFQVTLNELICTFIFVSVILMVKIDEDHAKVTKDGIAGALTVAIALLAMGQTGGKLGACYNPVVGLVAMVNAVSYLDNNSGYLTHYTPYYVIGPLLGGLFAGLFHLLHKHVLLEQPKD